MDAQVQDSIRDALAAHVTAAMPGASLRAMYGGTVFELEPGNAKSRIGGVYAYDGHVSLELAKGAKLSDPLGVLEGSGKQRRHIKLRALADVAGKGCGGYLDQAIAFFAG